MDTLFAARLSLQIAVGAFIAAVLSGAKAEVPQTVATTNVTQVVKVHAEGAQIYECKVDARGQQHLAVSRAGGDVAGERQDRWPALRRAALGTDRWQRHRCGSGRASAGATPDDIPLLKLKVNAQNNVGRLADVTVVQRLNTSGGVLEGSCNTPGAFKSVPYAADYAFLKPAD